MKAWVERNLAMVVIGIGVVALLSLVLTVVQLGVMGARIADGERRLVAAEDELVSLKSGVTQLLLDASTLTSALSGINADIGPSLDEAIASLEAFGGSTIEFTVAIDEQVPIEADIVFDRTIDVPVMTTLPIDEVVETTITVAGPFGTEIPVDVTVPIALDLPIDLEFPLEVSEQIPVSTVVPVQLDVPVRLDVGDTDLATLATALGDGLRSLREVLNALG